MAYEIERKFLVRDTSWRIAAGIPTVIRQAYLSRGRASLRIRIEDNVRATLTVKSEAAVVQRLEFEYPIPLADATALFSLRDGAVIEKLRHKLPQHDLTWEIDVFQGENEGLVVAEIELPREDKQFEKPSWLGVEITAAPCYSNASLAKAPFRGWSARLAR
jgi:adenylate cyclase